MPRAERARFGTRTCQSSCRFAITVAAEPGPSGSGRADVFSRRCTMALLDSVLGLDPFFADLDRISQRLLGSVEAARGATSAMPIEVLRRGDHLLVRLDLPGVPSDAVDVTVDGRTLTVEATRTA